MPNGKTVSGKRIRELREARSILQHDLASKLRSRGFGTTQVTVSRWENGQEPRAHVLPALAEVLGVEMDDLFIDDDAEERSISQMDMAVALAEQAALIAEFARQLAKQRVA